MRTPVRVALFAGAALSAAPPARGQTPDSAQLPAGYRCGPKHPVRAIGEGVAVNVAVNRWDAWVREVSWAYVGASYWSNNIRYGWEWDEDDFGTNMFSHPFHGSLYFNAGRSECLGYWESVPLTFLGSWTWEYFGERYRPALNDFLMTSLGGIALGEALHRVAATIRDNGARGRGRILREIGGLVVDPVGGLNRLVRGDWTRVGPNPPEHDPGAFLGRFHLGARIVGDSGSFDHRTGSATLETDVDYGDPFARPFTAPFDVFSARLQVSPGGGGLNLVRATARLYGSELTRPGRRNRHQFVVNQRYEYVNNPAFKFGAQSVETGLLSRWHLGRGAFAVDSKLAADAIVLGAIDAPFAGVGLRTYDFGPGLGLTLQLTLLHRGIAYAAWYNRGEYLHSVSGAEADHYVGFSGLELEVPVTRGLGVGAFLSEYGRVSIYTDKPRQERSFPEIHVFVSWSATRSPPVVPIR